MTSLTKGLCRQRSCNLAGQSSAMCASGFNSRNRCTAGIDMTASPIQLVERTRMRGSRRSTMADFSDGVIEVLRACNDFDFDAQEQNRNVAAVDFGETNGVLFGGEDGGGAALEAAVDHVDDFLLRVTVMVGVAAGGDDGCVAGAPGSPAKFWEFDGSGGRRGAGPEEQFSSS